MSVARVQLRLAVCFLGCGVWVGALDAQGPPLVMPPDPVDQHDLSGYWELGPDGRSISTVSLISSITPAILQNVKEVDEISMRWCRPLGMPAEMDAGRPISITQGRREILITFEASASPRHLYLRDKHVDPNIWDPTSVGDSIAHWQGDTLLADTQGFHPKNGRMMIPGGGYRTEKARLAEEFKLINNGQVLSVKSTWTDPSVFQAPHTYEYRYSRIPGKYEPRPAIGCNPWDDARAEFVERTFSPALKKAAEAAAVKPGTQISVK